MDGREIAGLEVVQEPKINRRDREKSIEGNRRDKFTFSSTERLVSAGRGIPSKK